MWQIRWQGKRPPRPAVPDEVGEATILYEDRERAVDGTHVAGDELWIALPELNAATGWELKPEGVCKDETCVPVPAARRASLVREEPSGTLFNLSEFARLIEQPFTHDANRAVWHFGPPGWEWKARLTSQQAPDFSLPDLAGVLHTLKELLGKKVFLLFWATW